ncbi:MAG TPA: PspC domain-containing protein [Marmoricola sp.]|jgi:phage shock protein PspC (stress-responsive transcriptional regulator)|nr:PspC domain-containing protein [Marmoricola sp.]
MSNEQQQPPPPPPYQGPYQQGPYHQGPDQFQARQLTRTPNDQMVAGVCGGLARYLGIDPTLVRVAAVVALVFGLPATLIAYAVAWAIMPVAG